ncbi:MAG: FliM/FliN family flagellar motor switch protein [Calditerrivibrio sp.]|nr:FliM/FliN family flagellar motor switch protein [Calditerrivibrio sp.]
MDKDYIIKEFGDVIMDVTVELGRKLCTIGELLSWDKGTIIKLGKTSGEAVDMLVNNKPLAIGEIMVLDEKFAFRLSDIQTKAALAEMKKDRLYE